VAYKRLDLHDGGNLQLAWIVYRFALLSNQLQLAWIVYRWMSMVVLTMGLTVDLTLGLTVGSTWLCWAIDLSKAFDSSDKRLNELVVLQTCFTGFVKQTPCFTGSLTAL
jgi:hypothetical protein